jgi:folate-binding protein YgfZ
MTVPQGYDAARRGAAFLERESRGKIAVAGNDRKTYLHAMLTNDIATLEPGTGCYAAYLTAQGRMITDLRVLEVGDMTLLELRAGDVPAVLEKLDAFIFTEDVRLGDLTAAFAEIRVAGPSAASVVAAALGRGTPPGTPPSAENLRAWPEFRNARAALEGQMVLVVATRELGVPGFDLFVEHAHRGRLADALAAAGAERMSDQAAGVLRIEAGTPLFGVDMDAETIPLEAGIEGRAISFSKGCYPGQEVIVRVVHRGGGRVARRLVGLTLADDRTPSPGEPLYAGDREVGKIRSAAWSPSLGRPVALAYAHRDFTDPGTELRVGSARAIVTALPFVAGSAEQA